MKKRRKFLVPLDGSERALMVCRHLASLAPLRGMQAVLFHVFSRYPESKYAEAENFGIIVLGRRGVSRVRDFFIGRVTNKVVHLARDRSVCIVH